VGAAVSLLAQHGGAARVYAGGTELLVAMKEGLLRYDHLINIKTISGLSEVRFDRDAGVLSIGPTATHRDLELSPAVKERFPLLAEVERRVANVRVRNVGTIGGNLCFADPHSDPGAVLLLYDARLEATRPAGKRSFPLEELVVGPYQTSLHQEELLTRVLVPPFPPGMKGAYLKFGYHERPSLGVGVAVRLVSRAVGGRGGRNRAGAVVEEVRIAVGSVGPRPLRVREAERLLQGLRVAELLRDGPRRGPSALDEAARLAARAARPVSDLHGSAEYKEHLIGVFLRRAFQAAVTP
jgi:carbon-monoxide dehydrogenase medium subunit